MHMYIYIYIQIYIHIYTLYIYMHMYIAFDEYMAQYAKLHAPRFHWMAPWREPLVLSSQVEAEHGKDGMPKIDSKKLASL